MTVSGKGVVCGCQHSEGGGAALLQDGGETEDPGGGEHLQGEVIISTPSLALMTTLTSS